MRLSADIKWIDLTSKARMREHLLDFICNKRKNLKRIFEGSNPPDFDRVEISVKCGKVAERSSFVFLRRPRNKSRIIGACSTKNLIDLIDDFDFLKEQMNKSNLNYTLSDPKVYLDDKKLVEEADKRSFQMKSLLADFLGIIGFISGAATIFFFGEFNQITILSLILGLIFLMGSAVIGCLNHPKYVLVEQE